MIEGKITSIKTQEQLHSEYSDLIILMAGLIYFIRDMSANILAKERMGTIAESWEDMSSLLAQNQITLQQAVEKGKDIFEDARKITMEAGVPPEALSKDNLREYYAIFYAENSQQN